MIGRLGPVLALAAGLASAPLPALAVTGDHWEDDDLGFSLDLPPIGSQSLNGTLRAAGEARQPDRLDTIAHVFQAVRWCWRPPQRERGQEPVEVTIIVGFRRDGSVIGAPRVTFSRGVADPRRRQEFQTSIEEAVARCAPLPLTEGLGAAIAGRPFTFRFIDDRQD